MLPHFFDDNQRASFHRLRESRKPDINMNCKKVIVYDCLPKNTDGSYHTGNIKEIAYMLLDVCRKRLIASGESELPSFSSFSSASNGGFLLFFSSSRHAMRFVHSLYDYDLENPIRLPNGEPCFPTFNCLGK